MLKLGKLEFEVESADLFAEFSDAGMGIFDPAAKKKYPEFEGDVTFSELGTSFVGITDLECVKAALSDYIDMDEFEFKSE